uniref:Uncharacterized protein LOC105639203 isoform X3 n=1 Tax=Rhizophora mucronata TaxID=61149 RepID=A0A2P2Q2W7_RHIMU
MSFACLRQQAGVLKSAKDLAENTWNLFTDHLMEKYFVNFPKLGGFLVIIYMQTDTICHTKTGKNGPASTSLGLISNVHC